MEDAGTRIVSLVNSFAENRVNDLVRALAKD
jgi:hypothetical protein